MKQHQLAETSDHHTKDGWDKFQICITAVIAATALFFSATYYTRQIDVGHGQISISKLALDVTKAQAENALVQAACSPDARLRSMGLYLAETLDKPFAVKLAQVLSASDPVRAVRGDATTVLHALAHDSETAVRVPALASLSHLDVIEELRSKGLLKKLKDAAAYLAGG